jgi:hypothetical protein
MEEKIKEKELVLTGLAIDCGDDSGVACYLCKRSQDSVSVYYNDDEMDFIDLKMGIASFEFDGHRMNYPLCFECFVLLKGFSESSSFVFDGCEIRSHDDEIALEEVDLSEIAQS